MFTELEVADLRVLAERGAADAQSDSAGGSTGRGVGQDNTETVRWYRRSAEQGHPLGQNNLGVMFDTGRGLREDEEAVRWYRRAAAQGRAQAQYNLGVMYEFGLGISQDRLEADAQERLDGLR